MLTQREHSTHHVNPDREVRAIREALKYLKIEAETNQLPVLAAAIELAVVAAEQAVRQRLM